MTRVLLIDDNMFIGSMVTRYLKGYDCKVEFLSSPFGVLRTVRNFSPDVILLDIKLPGLRGDTLAKLLMDNRDKLNDFRIILFSSEEEAVQKEMVEQSLADGYFLKSGSVQGLEKVVFPHMDA